MIYSSLIFIYLFFPVSVIVNCFTPQKKRDTVLFALSVLYCGMCGMSFMIFVLCFTAFYYFLGLLTEFLRKKNVHIMGAVAVIGAVTGIVSMLVFRMDFFSSVREKIPLADSPHPLGTAFFTLSAIGYILEICRGKTPPEKNFIVFALYIMMFPRMAMGPLMTYKRFRKLHDISKISLENTGKGVVLFIKGLAKKVLLADNLYMMFSAVTANLSAVNAWLGTGSYVLCLYFTLSGFSDMGLGLGLCFGYRFPHSFCYPLFSSKIKYFAYKWNNQLIRWLREYFAIPLYSKTSNDWVRRLIFVMTWGLAGFWYFCNLNSFIWGVLIGVSILAENFLVRTKMLRATGVIYTSLLVFVTAVFLGCKNFSAAMEYLFIMTGGNGNIANSLTFYVIKSYIIIILISIYCSTGLFRNLLIRLRKNKFGKFFSVLRPIVSLVLLILCTSFMSVNGESSMFSLRL